METFMNILQKVFIFEKEPQKIGLTQFKESKKEIKQDKPSIKKRFPHFLILFILPSSSVNFLYSYCLVTRVVYHT